VEARNEARIVRALEMAEEIRRDRIIVDLTIRRVGVDPRPVSVQIIDDAIHRRRGVLEDGEAWPRVWSRKALVKWFDQILKSAGV